MAKVKVVVTPKNPQHMNRRLSDLLPIYVDVLHLSGFKWKCPFKYKCSQHRGDIFCKVCYAILASKLEDLGFSSRKYCKYGSLQHKKIV